MKIEIFGKPNCSFCASATNLLKIKKIEFEYTDFTGLAQEDQKNILDRAPNASSYPIIFLEDTYIGGFQQLESAFK